MQSVFSTNGRRPKGLKSTYVRDLFSNNILRFFRASPQQHVSSLRSVGMTNSRFDEFISDSRYLYSSVPHAVSWLLPGL